MVAEDTPETLSKKQQGDTWTLAVEDPPSDFKDDLSEQVGLVSAEDVGDGRYQLVLEDDSRVARKELFEYCRDRNAPILELSREERDLEDIFFELTEEDAEVSEVEPA